MRVIDRILSSFAENPVAWLLFGLLVVAEYGNYETGSQLSHVCTLVQPTTEITAPAGDWLDWQRSEGAEIERICSNRESIEESE